MLSGTVLETTWKNKPLGFRNDDFLENGKGIRASLIETGTFLVNAKGICNGNPKEPLTIFVCVSLLFFLIFLVFCYLLFIFFIFLLFIFFISIFFYYQFWFLLNIFVFLLFIYWLKKTLNKKQKIKSK